MFRVCKTLNSGLFHFRLCSLYCLLSVSKLYTLTKVACVCTCHVKIQYIQYFLCYSCYVHNKTTLFLVNQSISRVLFRFIQTKYLKFKYIYFYIRLSIQHIFSIYIPLHSFFIESSSQLW